MTGGRNDSAGAGGAPGASRVRYDADLLLEVAVTVFNERGYDATSVGDIARAAGLSKSSLYHHVDSKEDLLRRALDRALDGLFAILAEDGARQGAALDRFGYVIARQVEVLTAELPYVTLLLRARGNTETERWALERRRTFDRHVADLVAAAVAEGGVRTDLDAALVERLVEGMVNSIVEWYHDPHGPDTELAAVVATLATGALRGAEGPGAADGARRTPPEVDSSVPVP